jgi:8-oxo-dGTP pyrophosphatase MutT (NUDIX family)
MPEIKTKYIECYIFLRSGKDLLFLLLKRNGNQKIYPGIWQIITGKIEKGESSIDTAVREVKEETGLNMKDYFVFPEVSRFYNYKNDTINLIPLFAAETEDKNVMLSDEHEEYKWLKCGEAVELIHWQSQKNNLKLLQDFLTDENKCGNLVKIEFNKIKK